MSKHTTKKCHYVPYHTSRPIASPPRPPGTTTHVLFIVHISLDKQLEKTASYGLLKSMMPSFRLVLVLACNTWKTSSLMLGSLVQLQRGSAIIQRRMMSKCRSVSGEIYSSGGAQVPTVNLFTRKGCTLCDKVNRFSVSQTRLVVTARTVGEEHP